MTRKDYKAFAEIIENCRIICVESDYGRGYENGYRLAVREIAEEMSKAFKVENPRFVAEKFLDACGI